MAARGHCAGRLPALAHFPHDLWRYHVRPERRVGQPRVLAVQFQDVTGHDAEQFKNPQKEVILWPSEYTSGEVRYPYDDAKK
jgi:hypothetical protein